MRRALQRAFPTFTGLMREAALFLWTVVREFLHDYGPLMASAMSFHATLSLFPILLLGVSILGYVYGSENAMREVLKVLEQYTPGPVVNTMREALITIVETRARVLAIGILALVWTATTVFINMEIALCITWSVRPRPFWKSRLLAISMLLVIGAVMVASLAFAAITLRIEGLHWNLFGRSLPEIPRAWHLLGYLMPFVLAVLAFTIIYSVLPNTRVHVRAAALGGLMSGLLWQVALHLFRIYLSGYAHYDVVYGSLGGAVVMVLWIYYTMTALLLGAEVAWQADQRLRAGEGRPSETPAEKLSSRVELPERGRSGSAL